MHPLANQIHPPNQMMNLICKFFKSNFIIYKSNSPLGERIVKEHNNATFQIILLIVTVHSGFL